MTAAYARIDRLLAAGSCVILDGGVGTEFPGVGTSDDPLWGVRTLVDDLQAVADVHRGYVTAGCDVITTNTWGLPSAAVGAGPSPWQASRGVHWIDIARRGLRVAREAVADAPCAVAFSLNGDIEGADGEDTIRLLTRAFADEAPDLILVETLSLVRESFYPTVERLLDTGLPVWLSFRRCPQGLCGVYGEHWGGPEGDRFGRTARRLEDLGIAALLVNCIPPDHVDGMVSFLRDFIDLPLGVYPNLGYLTSDGWKSPDGVGGQEYAAMALRWREEGAQIVGGCCGVGPEHIAAARRRLEGTAPGRRRRDDPVAVNGGAPAAGVAAWRDRRGRSLYPLEFPDIAVDPGVFPPASGSFLAWRHLFAEGIGAHQRCLDVGSGTGLLAVQLALNGAAHVHAIDVDSRAVACTRANAFRTGVAERVSVAQADVYPWVPDERYEVIVANSFQLPVDPLHRRITHRPVDYWGRNVMDQLIAKLPAALAPDGVAYLVHLSILSRSRTAELLASHGMEVTVVDYDIAPMPAPFAASMEHIARVEELSDAYHLPLSGHDALVYYLLEIRRESEGGQRRRGGASVGPWER